MPPELPPTAAARLMWSGVVLGALTVAFKCMGMCARTETLYEDMLGSHEHLPGHVAMALRWQHTLWENMSYAGIAALLLIGWIWVTRKPRALRAVVLVFLMLTLAQGITCVVVASSHVPSLMQQLDAMGPR